MHDGCGCGFGCGCHELHHAQRYMPLKCPRTPPSARACRRRRPRRTPDAGPLLPRSLSPRPRSAAAVASSSTRSFQRSPECPLTHRHVTRGSEATASSIRGSHRSRLATGFFLRVQPIPPLPALPPAILEAVHDVRRIAHHFDLRDRLCRPVAQRLECRHDLHALVGGGRVRAAGVGPPGTAQAQPPGPGFPRHAPSVYTVTDVVGGVHPSCVTSPLATPATPTPRATPGRRPPTRNPGHRTRRGRYR